jgi:hypothetical protein
MAKFMRNIIGAAVTMAFDEKHRRGAWARIVRDPEYNSHARLVHENTAIRAIDAVLYDILGEPQSSSLRNTGLPRKAFAYVMQNERESWYFDFRSICMSAVAYTILDDAVDHGLSAGMALRYVVSRLADRTLSRNMSEVEVIADAEMHWCVSSIIHGACEIIQVPLLSHCEDFTDDVIGGLDRDAHHYDVISDIVDAVTKALEDLYLTRKKPTDNV